MKRLALALPLALLVAAGPAAAATKKVTVNDDFYGIKSLTVKKGTKVKWVWNGDAPHDVTVQSGPESFRSKLQTSGKYSRVMKKKGTYQLLCTTHAPDMAMTLVVK